jgi:dUTP pyrophosphatase
MNTFENLLVKKLYEDAIVPERKSTDAAGFDISSYRDYTIGPLSWQLIDTGIAFTVPLGTYGQLASRSGLSVKGSMVGAGVIDRDYTGEVKVLLFNMSSTNSLDIKKSDRVAQLIIKRISTPEVKLVHSLDESDRGTSGFGSTGV